MLLTCYLLSARTLNAWISAKWPHLSFGQIGDMFQAFYNWRVELELTMNELGTLNKDGAAGFKFRMEIASGQIAYFLNKKHSRSIQQLLTVYFITEKSFVQVFCRIHSWILHWHSAEMLFHLENCRRRGILQFCPLGVEIDRSFWWIPVACGDSNERRIGGVSLEM